MEKRNDSIDVVKGFLIICVILGHVLLGAISENKTRGVIYSFHMPLFLFISGYMINLARLLALSFKDIFNKYSGRMLKAWLVAYIVFSAYQVLCEPSIKQVVGLVYSPWYHLWYVPTLFCYILMCKFLFSKTSVKLSYSISILVFIVWVVIDHVKPINMPRWCDCSQLPYFMLGLFLKNHFHSLKFRKTYVVVPILYIPLLFALQYVSFNKYGVIQSLLLLVVIMLFLYPAVVNDSIPKSKVLSLIGQNSLEIYLWHMIPVLLLKNFVSGASVYYYYAISFMLLFLFVLFINLRKTEQ